MQNLIVFGTVTNSEGEYSSERRKKLKNKENFHSSQANSPFIKLRFFLRKIHRQSTRRKGRDAEFNCLSNCHKFRWRILV